MGRAPCCEKVGLKKGPWTPEEDQILVHYINTYGHSNWRALPKQAGLLRCGKSCRLRWINYLKPDIKRGNFTREEEDTIIKLHEMLGNRWSAIAARLPGRTDNEIKNVWHTHLKKRLPQNQQNLQLKRKPKQKDQDPKKEQHPMTCPETHNKPESTEKRPLSPSQCSSTDMSEHNSSTATITTNDNSLALDDDFWSEVLSADNSGETSDILPAIGGVEQQFQFLFSPLETGEVDHVSSSSMSDGMDFWYDVYTRAEEFTGLPQL